MAPSQTPKIPRGQSVTLEVHGEEAFIRISTWRDLADLPCLGWFVYGLRGDFLLLRRYEHNGRPSCRVCFGCSFLWSTSRSSRRNTRSRQQRQPKYHFRPKSLHFEALPQ